MDTKTKVIVVGYCVVILCAVTFVPYVETRGNLILFQEYSFLWSNKHVMSIDYGRVTLTVIAETAVAAFCYLQRDWLAEILLSLFNRPPDPPTRY